MKTLDEISKQLGTCAVKLSTASKGKDTEEMKKDIEPIIAHIRQIQIIVEALQEGWGINTMANEKKPKLQLSGEDGNAFFIMGRARRAAKEAGWTNEKIEEYTKECQSGDYDHLMQTTMKYFEVE